MPNRRKNYNSGIQQAEVSTEALKIRDGFETLNTDLWDIVAGPNDLIELAGNTAGSGYAKISKSVDDEDTETTFLSKFTVDSPFKVGLGVSLSQRLTGQRFSIEFVGVDDNGNIVSDIQPAAALAISSISQTTTTATVVTVLPHGFVPGDRIAVYGVSESRMNYGEVYVATVTNSTTFTITSTPSTAITSQTIGAVTNGFVVRIDPFNYAKNAFGLYWEGTSAANAKLISRTNNGPLFNTADTSFGTHTVATQVNTNAYADAFNPTHTVEVRFKAEGLIVRTLPIDSLGGPANTLRRSQVLPDLASGYKIRLKARNNVGMSKTVGGGIVSAAKTATTTATITTRNPHGLTVGDFIQVYGIRDQVNFANLTVSTAVASVVDATNFTIAFGISATATSFGGAVIKMNGATTVPTIPQAVQSLTRTANEMTLVGSAAWTGLLIGETVSLQGLVDVANGVPYVFPGPYKILNISTTSLVLASPGPDQATLNVGGVVLKRTDFRLHLFRALDYNRQTVEIDGSLGNNADSQESLPVNIIGGSVAVTSTTVGGLAGHGVAISGSPVRLGGRALTANYAAVATGQTADLVTTLTGTLIQKSFSIPEGDWTFAVPAPIAVVTDTVLKAAGAAGIRNYMTAMQVVNTNAVASEIVIKDGATVIWRGFLPASMLDTISIEFPTPLRTTAATALNFAAITTGTNIYINAQGYQAP